MLRQFRKLAPRGCLLATDLHTTHFSFRSYAQSSSSAVSASPQDLTVPVLNPGKVSRTLQGLLRASAATSPTNRKVMPRRDFERLLRHSLGYGGEAGSVNEQEALSDGALEAAWRAVSAWHCVMGGEAWKVEDEGVMPFDWPRVIAEIARQIPIEGVTETDFLRRLRKKCPQLQQNVCKSLAGADSLGQWVQKHFADTLVVTRSATTGVPLYHAASHNTLAYGRASAVAGGTFTDPASPHNSQRFSGVFSSHMREVLALERALELLGRGRRLPLWTSFHLVSPLLPADVCPADRAEWVRFLQQPHIQQSFDVKARVSVRATRRTAPLLLIVDLTSLASAADATATTPPEWFSLLPALELKSGCYTACFLHRPSLDSESIGAHRQQLMRQCGVAPCELVVVDEMLDAEDVVGALLSNTHGAVDGAASSSSIPSNASSLPGGAGATGAVSEVVVLCGTAKRAAIQAALKDTLPFGVKARLCCLGEETVLLGDTDGFESSTEEEKA